MNKRQTPLHPAVAAAITESKMYKPAEGGIITEDEQQESFRMRTKLHPSVEHTLLEGGLARMPDYLKVVGENDDCPDDKDKKKDKKKDKDDKDNGKNKKDDDKNGDDKDDDDKKDNLPPWLKKGKGKDKDKKKDESEEGGAALEAGDEDDDKLTKEQWAEKYPTGKSWIEAFCEGVVENFEDVELDHLLWEYQKGHEALTENDVAAILDHFILEGSKWIQEMHEDGDKKSYPRGTALMMRYKNKNKKKDKDKDKD